MALNFFPLKNYLFLYFQTGKGGHSSVEDAKATMELFKVVESMWEQQLSSQPFS